MSWGWLALLDTMMKERSSTAKKERREELFDKILVLVYN